MSTLKVNTITTVDGTGNIVVSRPLSGSGASLTSLPAANLTGTLPAISGANLTGVTATPADNSITLAKLAPGTDGNLITYDASGDPAHVATGTAGHVLTSGGAGVAPTFAANTHIPADNSVTGAMIAMGSDAAGDVLTYNGTDYIRLAKGTAAQVLKMNAGATAVEWATDADTIGMAIPGSSVAGDTLYHNGTIYTRLAKGTAAQVLTMNSGATAPEWAAAGGGGGPTVVSATLTNGASSYTFSSLPSGITRMQLWFYEVSLSGTDELLVQFGDSGGIETSNYTTASGRIMVYNGTSSAISNNGGFIIRLFEAAGDWSGVYNFWKMAAYWVGAHSGYQASTSSATTGGGNKAGLSTLTQIKIRPSGSNTFTVAGSFVSKIDLLYWQD